MLMDDCEHSFGYSFISSFDLQANPYSLKEGGPAPGDVAGWSGPGLQTAPGYYPYDPTLAAYG
jgi:hypothetical protein